MLLRGILLLVWHLSLAMYGSEAEETSKQFKATIALSSSSVEIPNDFILTLRLRYPNAYRVDRGALRESLLQPLTLSSSPFKLLTEQVHSDVNGEEKEETILYTLQPQLPGRLPVTFMEMTFLPLDPGEKSGRILPSDLAFIDVSLNLAPNDVSLSIDPPLDLTGHLPLEWDSSEKALWLAQHVASSRLAIWGPLLFAALLLAFAILYFRKKRKIVSPKLSPAEESFLAAKQALEQISASPQSTAQQTVHFAMLVVEWLRDVFEERFDIAASAKTTEEFLQELQNSPKISRDMATQLRLFLTNVDQIKFAKHSPSSEECRHLISKGEEIVAALKF